MVDRNRIPAPPMTVTDPGLLTAVGQPAAQFVHDLAGVAVIGLLFLRCFALPGPPTPANRHLVAMVIRWAWLWVGVRLCGSA